MDLNKLIQEKVEAVVSEKLETILQDNVEKLLQSTIAEIFWNHGDVANNLKKTLEEKLDLNLDRLKVSDYNGLVANHIENCINQYYQPQGIEDAVKGFMGFIEEKEVQFSSLVEKWVEESMDWHDSRSHGKIALHIEDYDSGGCTVYVDIYEHDGSTSMNDCSLGFSVTSEGRIYSLFKQDYRRKKQNHLTPSYYMALSSMEREIFRLYAAGIKIIMDSYYNTSWDRMD